MVISTSYFKYNNIYDGLIIQNISFFTNLNVLNLDTRQHLTFNTKSKNNMFKKLFSNKILHEILKFYNFSFLIISIIKKKSKIKLHNFKNRLTYTNSISKSPNASNSILSRSLITKKIVVNRIYIQSLCTQQHWGSAGGALWPHTRRLGASHSSSPIWNIITMLLN